MLTTELTPTQTRAKGGRILAAGAAVFAVYAFSHPHGGEDAENLKAAVHSMAEESSTWVASHAIGMAALAIIAAGLVTLIRSGRFDDDARLRRWAWIAAAGAVVGVVEHIPHILVATETGSSSTPITDLHLALQTVFTPLYGLGVAGLAAVGFRRVAHPVLCALGIVGGVALTLAAPTLVITDDPAFGMLFMPAGGTFIFLLGMGLRAQRARA